MKSKTIEEPGEHFSALLNILCIDDNFESRDLLADMLTLNNHNVTMADSGKDGLKYFFDACLEGKSYDLVITDLGMPYPNGKTIAATIKSKKPETPVLLITGLGSLLEDDLTKNIDYILRKPLVIEALNEVLEKVILKNN